MKIWAVADTHFFHAAMHKHHGRKEGFEYIILKNLQDVMTRDDILIHLGDVSWKKQSEANDILSMVPGRKILVRGNHDYRSPRYYMETVFDFACDGFQMFYKKPTEGKKEGRNILFTHVPVEVLPRGCDINIHGHLHNNENSHRAESWYPKKFHKLVAIEDLDLKPIALDDLLVDGL